MSKELTKYNIIEEEIVTLYTEGYDREAIAQKLDIPISVVNRVFTKPDIKEKIAEIIEMRELLLREKHTQILDEVTDKMLEKAREAGDISVILNSNRDILDVIALTDKINKEQEKKRLGTSDKNVFVNILQQLTGDDDE